jgi:hypothetical protein
MMMREARRIHSMRSLRGNCRIALSSRGWGREMGGTGCLVRPRHLLERRTHRGHYKKDLLDLQILRRTRQTLDPSDGEHEDLDLRTPIHGGYRNGIEGE